MGASVSPARGEGMPVEALLAGYSPGIAAVAEQLRAIVRRSVPEAVERVRPGWRLIGYDLPIGKRTVYFAWVWPEWEHVHLGYQHGIYMADPGQRLHGAHLRLKKVRYVTFEPGADISTAKEAELTELTCEAARIARLPRAEQFALLMDHDLIAPA